MKDFLKDHWFKIAVLGVLIFIAIIIYNTMVLQPRIELNLERERIVAAEQKEEERQENLENCLLDSEYQRTSSHVALCGDPNVGRSPVSCSRVFGGITNTLEAIGNFRNEFPEKISKNEGAFEKLIEDEQLVNEFWDECNCGLEKYRRDELDEKKESRDAICFQKYGA